MTGTDMQFIHHLTSVLTYQQHATIMKYHILLTQNQLELSNRQLELAKAKVKMNQFAYSKRNPLLLATNAKTSQAAPFKIFQTSTTIVQTKDVRTVTISMSFNLNTIKDGFMKLAGLLK